MAGCSRRRASASRARRCLAVGAALVVSGVVAATANAQQRDSVRRDARPDTGKVQPFLAISDTTPPISPRRAFFSSLLVPGSAQVKLQRPTAAAIFVLVEAASVAMIRKSAADLRLARQLSRDSVIVSYTRDSNGNVVPVKAAGPFSENLVHARKTHFEDWVALLVFNHFFAGADGFVAAHLWDVPAGLAVEPRSRGVAIAARIRFR
jgi:hypothetical protein